MRHSFYLNRERDEDPVINLTPLIDVVFVILIMFILIAPILEMDQIELAGASPSSKNITLLKKEENPISIRVDQHNRIFLNNRLLKETEIFQAFSQLKLQHEKTKPLLYHDKRATFGSYQKIKSALEKAGFQEIDLVLGPEEK